MSAGPTTTDYHRLKTPDHVSGVAFEDIPRERHPHPDLLPFYRAVRVYLWFEALSALIWVAQMIAFKSAMGRIEGAQYRLANSLLLFHLGTPLAVINVTQQWRNNNSVLGWTFFTLFVGLAGDLESLVEVATGNLSDAVPWAWVFFIVLTAFNCTLSLTAFAIFVRWYYSGMRSIPPAASLVDYERTGGRKPANVFDRARRLQAEFNTAQAPLVHHHHHHQFK